MPPSDGPPPWAPPAKPGWMPPPPTCERVLGVAAGSAAWRPPGPPPGWTPPPPGGPPPAGWPPPPGPPPNEPRYSVAGIIVAIGVGVVVLIGALMDDGADVESPGAIDAT